MEHLQRHKTSPKRYPPPGWFNRQVAGTRPSQAESSLVVSATIRPNVTPRAINAPRGLGGAAVASVGVSLPEGIVESSEIEERLGLAPDWIERRTGIRERHVAAPDERMDTHATIAAQRALERAGVDPADVDLVLVATSTPDELMPNSSALVAKALGATKAGAFDIGAACAGFLTGLATGAGLIDSGRASCVVVVGADFMSRVVDPADRGTSAVFADGAGAVVMVASGETRIGPIVLGSDGDTGGIIVAERDDMLIRMQGHETFKVAVDRLSESTEQAAEAAGLRLDEIDLFVYHQANSRILTAVGERLGLKTHRVVDCIGGLGNTSAATVPLALDYAVDAGQLRDGDRVLVSAFGAGFIWGATVIEWGLPR
jgi:3-oxoacyl-[acyl-carrier-protein] synthase III